MVNTMAISGLLLVDKPKNATSHTICSIIKHTLNANKTGHCGTLDPLATGLLMVLIDKATKQQDRFLKADKKYQTEFTLGIKTDTGDTEGKVIEGKEFSHISLKDIETALEKFRGKILQTPPMFSAIKVGGKPLYKLARKGIEIERKPREIFINKIEIIKFDKGVLELMIDCSSGTYIRSIANDLGEALGTAMAVSSLRRISIGDFDVKNAVGGEHLRDEAVLLENIISLGDICG
jgi:tRNA pseudouridine55 synthase